MDSLKVEIHFLHLKDDLYSEKVSTKVNERWIYCLQGSCATDKFALDHESIIEYRTALAKLEQFTTCLWARFTKHDGDHVLFTYSGEL